VRQDIGIQRRRIAATARPRVVWKTHPTETIGQVSQ
jgi:hypothetical protein